MPLRATAPVFVPAATWVSKDQRRGRSAWLLSATPPPPLVKKQRRQQEAYDRARPAEKTNSRRRPVDNKAARRAWRRLLDEQWLMSREDPLRLRPAKPAPEPRVVEDASDTSSTTSATSSSSCSSTREDAIWDAIGRGDASGVVRLATKTRVPAAVLDEAVSRQLPADAIRALARRVHGKKTLALHVACRRLDAEAVEALLACGIEASRERNPLFWIAQTTVTGRRECALRVDRVLSAFGRGLKALLGAKAKADGSTVLHAVVANNTVPKSVRVELAAALVRRGASPRALDTHKRSPLRIAARSGCGDLVSALLQSYAAAEASDDAIDVLVDAAVGGCVGAVLDGRLAVDIDGVGAETKHTPLTAALRARRLESARRLVDRGCSLLAEDASGVSPVYAAIQSRRSDAVALVAAAASQQPADHPDRARARRASRDKKGGVLDARCRAVASSPYAFALSRGALDAAAVLAEHGARVDDDVKAFVRFDEGDEEPSDDRAAKGLTTALLELLDAQKDCDLIVGPLEDGATLGAHKVVFDDVVLAAFLDVPWRSTARVAALGALRYIYAGVQPNQRDALPYLLDLAVLASTARLEGLRDACVALASTKTTASFSARDAKSFAQAVGAPPDVVRPPLTPFSTRVAAPRPQRHIWTPADLVRRADQSSCVEIVCGPSRRTVHSALLRARVPFFDACIRWREHHGITEPIHLTRIDHRSLDGLVDYVYGVAPPRSPQLLLDLAAVANEYGVPDLKGDCDARLAKALDPTNLVPLFEAARVLHLPLVLRASARVCIQHLDAVARSAAFCSDRRRNKAAFVATVLRAALVTKS